MARWIRESTRGQYDRFGPDSQREQQDRFIERHGLLDTGLVCQVAESGWTVWRVPEAKADLLHVINERIVVAGRSIVSARLTPAAYSNGLARALPEKVAMARPEGVGRARTTTPRETTIRRPSVVR